MQRLISGESAQEVFVLFVNKSARYVDIFWINYKGKQENFGTIEPGGQRKINTFSTHPWIFRSKGTGEKLHIDNKDIFWPIPSFYNGRAARRVVCIHFPLRSLFVNSMWALVTSDSIDINNAKTFNVPVFLRSQIVKFHERYKSYSGS